MPSGREMLNDLLMGEVYGRNDCLSLDRNGRIVKTMKRDHLVGQRGSGMNAIGTERLHRKHDLHYQRGIGRKRKDLYGLLGVNRSLHPPGRTGP